MTAGTAQDQVLLGTYPQQTKNYLSIYRPAVALSCQVSGTYNVPNQTVGYDNVTSGSYTNITDYLFQVALIGTAPGLEDVGRTWVRSAVNGTLRFVESDHINWQDNLYITVLKYTEIIPVFPRIIQNPADETDVIFYKIWDVAYTNQNRILGTVINMGSNYAGFGTRVYWTASGTENLLGENVTYSWIFEGANITGSSTHTPGFVDYPGPGHYRTILTATSSSGAVDRSVRYVSLYNRPGEGATLPYLDWTRSEFGGSQDGRGYTCRIRVRDPIPENIVLDGAMVIIWSDDYYGDQQQSVSNNGLGRSHIKMEGYIEGGTIQYNYADGSVEFSVVSPTKIMEICQGFSISVESKPNPTTWYELYLMTIKRAIYHYLRWQSTVLLCCDVGMQFTDRDVQYFDADRTSLYDAIYSFINGTIYGTIVADKLGKLWMFQEVGAIDSPTTALPVGLTVDASLWAGQPIITERHYNDTCFIEMGGIVYTAASGESTALLGSAPGTSPAYHGRVDKKQGLALLSQSELNTLVGNLYAYRNCRYPDVQQVLKGNFCNLDIAPPELVRVNMLSHQTPRRITWTNKLFYLTGISWSRDERSQVERPTLTLAEVSSGYAGDTISIPVEPPTTSTPEGGNSYAQTPIATPSVPGISAGISGIDVYYNGNFVMTTTKLNFIGQIVYVQNNTTEGRADIFFDACGCSGTFLSGSYGIQGNLDTSEFNAPVANRIYYLAGLASGSYIVNYDSHGFFDNIENDATFTLPFTGQWEISWESVVFGVGPNSSGFDFNYEVTMTIGQYTQTITGRQTGTYSVYVKAFTDGLTTFYGVQGQKIVIRYDVTITNLPGATRNPDDWDVYTLGTTGFFNIQPA